MENNSVTMTIRKGRTKKEQYYNLDFELIDMMNEYGNIELLGFHSTFVRYINRKDFKNKNEVNYTQEYLSKQMSIGKTKYYKNLKTLYNCEMLDIEKEMTFVYYVNFPNGESIKQEKTITFFSTLQNIDISMKDPKTKLGFPVEYINIVSSKTKTIYVIHELPNDDMLKNKKLEKTRDYDIDLDKFRRGKGQPKKDNKSCDTPSSQNEKGGTSQNEKEAPSQNRKLNTIIISSNTRILSPNIINHSFFPTETNERMNENKKLTIKVPTIQELKNLYGEENYYYAVAENEHNCKSKRGTISFRKYIWTILKDISENIESDRDKDYIRGLQNVDALRVENEKDELVEFNGKTIHKSIEFYYKLAYDLEKSGRTDTNVYKSTKKEIEKYELKL